MPDRRLQLAYTRLAVWGAILACALLVLAPVASAQVGGRAGFEGKVVDPEGNPVSDLRLVVRPAGGTGGSPVTLKVNKKGEFETNFLPIGRYAIETKGDKYFLKSVDAVVYDNGGLEVMSYHRDAHPEHGLPSFQVSSNARPVFTLTAVPAEEREKLQQALAVGAARGELEELLQLYQTGQNEALVQEAQAVLKENPDLPPALLFYGLGLQRVGRTAEAEEAFRRVLELDPSQPNIHGLLGTLLVQEAGQAWGEEPEKAKELFAEAADLLTTEISQAEGSVPTQLVVNRTIAIDRSGTRDEAILAYEELIEVEPNRGPAYLRLADLYREAGREEDAIALLERAPKGEVESAAALYNVAVRHFNEREYQTALEVLKRAAAVDPEHAMVHRLMGRTYLALNEVEEARRELSRALELDQSYEGAEEDRQILEAMGGPIGTDS